MLCDGITKLIWPLACAANFCSLASAGSEAPTSTRANISPTTTLRICAPSVLAPDLSRQDETKMNRPFIAPETASALPDAIHLCSCCRPVQRNQYYDERLVEGHRQSQSILPRRTSC